MKRKFISRLSAALTAAAVSLSFTAYADDEGVRGDANSDGRANIRDCAYIANMLAKGKDDELCADSDYNIDGRRTVSDAAALARAISINTVQTYDSCSVRAGIRNGMTKDEVIAYEGDIYSSTYIHETNPEGCTYVYSLKKIRELETDLPAELVFEFNKDGILFNTAYHIGRKSSSGKNTYACSKEELSEAYDEISELLTTRYGIGRDTKIGIYDEGKEHEWIETDFGDVWMIYGTDLWIKDSGVNEILISCYSPEYAPKNMAGTQTRYGMGAA